MPHDHLAPDTLFPSAQFGFSQAVVASGGRTVYCAGQTAWTTGQEIVGPGDLKAQMTKALENCEAAVIAAGGTRADIVRLTIFVPDYEPERCLDPVVAALTEFFADGKPPANSLIGVAALALPDFLVEIEATAVIA